MKTQQDWEWLAVNSHYQTAIAVRQLLEEGKSMEATQGLEVLISAIERWEKQMVERQLIRLMSHIIKWKCQPEQRHPNWAIAIRSARTELEDSQEEVPTLTQNFLRLIWNKCFQEALKLAELELGINCSMRSLSWSEVFDDEYRVLPLKEQPHN